MKLSRFLLVSLLLFLTITLLGASLAAASPTLQVEAPAGEIAGEAAKSAAATETGEMPAAGPATPLGPTVPDIEVVPSSLSSTQPPDVIVSRPMTIHNRAVAGNPLCSSDTPIAIPDNTPAGVASSIVLADPGTLTDLNVFISTTHTWVGDLIFSLEHVDTGSTAVIFNRPGVPASTFGCSGNDILATIDDEAATPVETECAAGVPTINGSFIGGDPPDASLLSNAFDGESLAGTWTLTVSDNAGGDTGSLVEWCLEPTTGPPPMASVAFTKTVGLPGGGILGSTDAITVTAGSLVHYFYQVGNTGNVTLNLHDLVDSELGIILDDFPFALTPGASVWLTQGAVITQTTVNSATWTAFNAGPTDVASDSDTATVNVTAASGSICSTDTPLAIPDNTPAGVVSTRAVAESGTIADLNVVLSVTHTWVGDLIFTLEHFDTASSATIVDRPGVPASTFGCSGNDIAATIDDEAATGVEAECAAGTPTIAGTFIGGDPTSATLLSTAFDGENINGTWRLTASDNAGGDTGDLVEWCLEYTPTLANAPAVRNVRSGHTPQIHGGEAGRSAPTGGGTLNWTIVEEAPVSRPQAPFAYPAGATTLGAPEGDAVLGTAPAAFGEPVTPERETPEGLVTITHSLDQSIIPLNSVACNAGGLHTDNSYLRVFDLNSFGITGAFDVVEVEVGIETASGAGGTQPIEARLYTWDPADPFIFANFTSIGSTATTIPDQAGTIFTIPVAGTAPAGSTLVVEIFTPDGRPAGNSFFIGSNDSGQTAPSYLAAADCGIPEPMDTGALGFPDMHVVMNVTGDDGTGGGACTPGDIPWASVNPTAGSNAPSTATVVDVTFDSTGLAEGLYTGNLCVNSDDPDEPQVVVPLTLNVVTPPMPAIVFTKTVGLDPGACAASSSITVPAGTSVTYCYAVENTGNVTLTQHDLVDSELGTILNDFTLPLGPGSSVVLTQAATINVTTTNVATWTAYNFGPRDVVSDTDSATVNVIPAVPDIDVNPTSLSETLPPGGMSTQSFDIGNVGTADLDWTIDEAAPLAPFGAGPPGLGAATEEVEGATFGVPVAAPLTGFTWPAVVLWDNGPLVNCAGCGVGGADESVLQNTSLGMTTLGFGHQVAADNWVADDFTVADAAGWNVTGMTFFAYQTGSSTTSTMTNINWIIFDGEPGAGGSAILSGGGLDSTGWSNIYRVTETTSGSATNRPIMASTVNVNFNLPAGTYWVAWQTDGTLASGPWAPPITINGSTTTGNGLQSTDNGATWGAANDGGTGSQQGFPFILDGTVGAGGCTPSDIPWASVNPLAGTTAPASSTPVDVMFDATGLADGVYTGDLCINSNDPDEPLVTLPLTLTVVTPAEPDITVSPSSLSETLLPGGMSTQNFDIGNVGTADLNWTIDEQAPPLWPAPQAPVGGLAAAAGGAGAGVPALAPEALLYDQTDSPGTNGAPSQYFDDFAGYGIAAEDIVVPAGGWTITRVVAIGGYTAGDGPSPLWVVTFRADAAGLPGGIVYTTTTTAANDVGGIVTIDLPVPAALAAGTYWVTVAADMPFNPGTQQWFWSTRAVQNGAPYHWTETGLFGSPCVGFWAPGAATCGVGGGVEPDLLFALYGTVGAGGCTPSDIPWASVNPLAGTTAPAATTPVDVMFDATGLTPGVYTGDLCINSNDPDEPLVTLPLTLTVLPEPEAALSLVKTVSDDGSCGATDTITVTVGTEVTYCYRATNTGQVTFTEHTLTDTVEGTLFMNFPAVLPPGFTATFTTTSVMPPPTPPFPGVLENCAIWTGFEATGAPTQSNEDCATVFITQPTDVSLTGLTGENEPVAWVYVGLALLGTLLGGAIVLRRRETTM